MSEVRIIIYKDLFNSSTKNDNKRNFILISDHFYSILGFPLNWSMEQLNPKAWQSLMEAGSGKIAFNATSPKVHQGSRRTSLLVSVAPTTLSATYSGTRIGMILLLKHLNENTFQLITANYLNPIKHSC